MDKVWGDDDDGTTVACAHPAMPLVYTFVLSLARSRARSLSLSLSLSLALSRSPSISLALSRSLARSLSLSFSRALARSLSRSLSLARSSLSLPKYIYIYIYMRSPYHALCSLLRVLKKKILHPPLAAGDPPATTTVPATVRNGL